MYGQPRQFATPPDTTKYLDKNGTKYVQQVVSSFLYYARAVNNTIITALNDSSKTSTTNTKYHHKNQNAT